MKPILPWPDPPPEKSTISACLKYDRYVNWFMFRYWNTSQTPMRKVIELNKYLIK